jgi:hypothetical protein
VTDRTESAFTDDLCARDALAARTRTLLLRLEEQGHRLGWDHPDGHGVFRVQYNPHTKHVESYWANAFTALINYVCGRTDGDVGQAFQFLAEHVELAASGEFDADLPPELRGILMRRTADTDLFSGRKPGWKFYGYGHRCEAWMVRPEGRDQLTGQPLSEHPDRVEIRQVCFAARDGLFWWLHRIRGGEPTVYVERPESDRPMGGVVTNALGRLTNVVAGNPVPVRPAVPPAFRRAGSP